MVPTSGAVERCTSTAGHTVHAHTWHIVGACRLRSNPVNVGFVKVGGSIGVALDGFSGSGVTLPKV